MRTNTTNTSIVGLWISPSIGLLASAPLMCICILFCWRCVWLCVSELCDCYREMFATSIDIHFIPGELASKPAAIILNDILFSVETS